MQMLVHIGQGDVATRAHNAWLKTIEDGIHTYDIFDLEVSSSKVGTAAFADAVIARLGEQPSTLAPVRYADAPSITVKVPTRTRQKKEQVGIDVFLDVPHLTPDELGRRLEPLAAPHFQLDMLSNRGQKVYPDGAPETLCVDAFRCRFLAPSGTVQASATIELLGRLDAAGFPFIKSEGLFTFDGAPGFSKGQGQ
jgi:isocitrate dehydrogenase